MLCLGFAGAVLAIGHHVVGLDQEGSVGYFGFFLGGLRGQQESSQCLEQWLSRWGPGGEDTLNILNSELWPSDPSL